MGSERSTEMDSGILYFTTILDDMWRGFKKFFLLCFLLMAVCGAVMYMREKTNYTPVYQAYSSFVVETKTAYGYNQSYSDETTAGFYTSKYFSRSNSGYINFYDQCNCF